MYLRQWEREILTMVCVFSYLGVVFVSIMTHLTWRGSGFVLETATYIQHQDPLGGRSFFVFLFPPFFLSLVCFLLESICSISLLAVLSAGTYAFVCGRVCT